MKNYKLILLLVAVSAIFLPYKTLAADRAMIASEDKNIKSFEVDTKNKNRIIYNNNQATYLTDDGGKTWIQSNTPGVSSCAVLLKKQPKR